MAAGFRRLLDDVCGTLVDVIGVFFRKIFGLLVVSLTHLIAVMKFDLVLTNITSILLKQI